MGHGSEEIQSLPLEFCGRKWRSGPLIRVTGVSIRFAHLSTSKIKTGERKCIGLTAEQQDGNDSSLNTTEHLKLKARQSGSLEPQTSWFPSTVVEFLKTIGSTQLATRKRKKRSFKNKVERKILVPNILTEHRRVL